MMAPRGWWLGAIGAVLVAASGASVVDARGSNASDRARASAAPARFRPLRNGDAAPPFVARLLRHANAPDSTASLDALRGRTVLLNIWATWCTPCRREMPALDSLARDYADRGVVVVGVSIDGEGKDADVRAFLHRHGIGFPILRDEGALVSSRFRTRGVPESFLIDAGGRVAYHWLGGVDTPAARLRPILDSLLAAPAAK